MEDAGVRQELPVRRTSRIALALSLASTAFWLAPSQADADHNQDAHSTNMRLLGSSPQEEATNSDLAFWGSRVYAGTYDGFRIIDVSNPRRPVVLSYMKCAGGQGDVSVWRNLLFRSTDAPQTSDACDSEDTLEDLPGFEGIRIFDVSNPRKPRLIKGVATDCGSHTHTLVPAGANTVYVYVSSYPLSGQGPDCNVHSKISIIKVPLKHPRDSAVVGEPFIPQIGIGCHDITVFTRLKIAAAACLTEGQLWDVSDPENPVVTAHIYNPLINIWHGSAFSMDGRVVAFGDESGGAGAPACLGSNIPTGAIWFYDVANPVLPLGRYNIPRPQVGPCTAHNFNVVPTSKRHVLVSAWYPGGTTVVDFTDPSQPFEIGYYQAVAATEADTWSSYWYNGYIYANDITRGLDVFQLRDPAVAGARTFDHLNPQTQETMLGSP
jgi:hypothetical protein